MDARFDHRPTAAIEVSLRSLDPDDDFKERTLIMEPSTSVAVGRASKSTHKNLRSSATNAFIDSPVVSRDHALLMARTTTGIPTVYIKDLGSMHGTAVNGHTLTKSQEYRLSAGDVIQFGTDVVRDSHTFVATKFRFHSKPYSSTSTFALPDSEMSEEEDENLSDDDNSDVSVEERSSSVAPVYSPSEHESDIQPDTTMTMTSTYSFPVATKTPKVECLGSQFNPFYLADDEQIQLTKPVVIDLDGLDEVHVGKEKGAHISTTPHHPGSHSCATASPERAQSSTGLDIDKSSCDESEESIYGGPSDDDATSPFEDYNSDNEYGSDVSIFDAMSLVASEFDVHSDKVSEISDDDNINETSSAPVDHVGAEDVASDAEKSSHSPHDGSDAMAHAKMLEMLDHHANGAPGEEHAPRTPWLASSGTNIQPDAQIKYTAVKDLPIVLPAPSTTLARPVGTLHSLGSMSLKNIMHQEKGDESEISVQLPENKIGGSAMKDLPGKVDNLKMTSGHPWDWSYSYDYTWPFPTATSRQGTDLGSYISGREEDCFAPLTSSRFDNPYVGPQNRCVDHISKGDYTYSTCPPVSQQASIHGPTVAVGSAAASSYSAEQSNLHDFDQGTVAFPMIGQRASQDKVEAVAASCKPTAAMLSAIQKQKERTGMSIPEIVEPAVTRDDEPVISKKRKFASIEVDDATMAGVQSEDAVERDEPSHGEENPPIAQSQRPIKRMRLRKTVTAVAGILVGTVSAVGALAFLPDAFFQ